MGSQSMTSGCMTSGFFVSDPLPEPDPCLRPQAFDSIENENRDVSRDQN
jgi:hypothetical protein